jgi:hypothetical protein
MIAFWRLPDERHPHFAETDLFAGHAAQRVHQARAAGRLEPAVQRDPAIAEGLLASIDHVSSELGISAGI